MQLIVWRHAEAEDGIPDEERALTEKGQEQARKMAQWLKQHLPEPMRVLVSPARRAQQTAQALGVQIETREELGVGSSARRILRATDWPHGEGTLIVVGHQPALGRLAAVLLSGKEADWHLKKGAMWWFETTIRADRSAETFLRTVLAPKEV